MNETWQTRWRAFQGEALFAYSRLVTKTSRFRIEGWHHLETVQKSGRPLVWSLWHGQIMCFVVFGDYCLNTENFVGVVVGGTRGDTLGAYGARVGGTPIIVDMEGNPFAAGRAVIRIIEALKEGKEALIAPDGPDGPAFVPKGGVAVLASKAEAAVLPIGLWTRQAYTMSRWDHYLVPLPFARFHVALGEPIFPTRNMDRNELLEQISAALHKARARAQVLAGVRPWR